ncbi:hypothetical protein Esti_002146 [Eimeria stiedai]
MAASQEPEGEHSLELPVGHRGPLVSASRSRPHLNKRSAIFHFDTLFPGQWHAQEAVAASGVLAVIIASLALLYLMVTCVRHVSGPREVTGQRLRYLARKFPHDEDESCLESLLAEGEEQEQGEDGGAGAQEGVTAAVSPHVVEQGSWRHLPLISEEKLKEALELLREPLVIVRRLLPVLKPEHTMSLTWVLGRLLCLELSALAIVPYSSEHLRAQVAQEYVAFIEELLTTGDFEREEEANNWEFHLRVVQVMIKRLAESSRPTEKLTRALYISFIVTQRNLCRLHYCLILQLLESVEAFKTEHPSKDPEDLVSFILHPLNELYRTRLLQILHRVTSRFWLSFHQVRRFPSYFFDEQAEEVARMTQAPSEVPSQQQGLFYQQQQQTSGDTVVLPPQLLDDVAAFQTQPFETHEGEPLETSLYQHYSSPSQQQQLNQQQQQTSGDTTLPPPQLMGDTETFQSQTVVEYEGEQRETSLHQYSFSSASPGLTQRDTDFRAPTPVPLFPSSENQFSWMYGLEMPLPDSNSSRRGLPREWYASSPASPDAANAPPASAEAAAVEQPSSVSGVFGTSEQTESTGDQPARAREEADADAGEDSDAVELLQLIERTVRLGLFPEDQETGNG